MKEKEFQVEKACILPFGAAKAGRDLVVSLPTEEKITGIELYNRVTKEKVGYGKIGDKYKEANIYSFAVKGAATYNYILLNEKEPVRDTYAKIVSGSGIFGKGKTISYGVYNEKFDWQNDVKPNYNYEDSFIYKLHVRGFTKHSSSKVKNKGTFAGIVEKINYLKELGITAVELMPAYEFDETIRDANGGDRVNYWGYGNAYYFAPKEAYSSKKNGGQINEFKNMVRELHKAGIEVIMDFYFVPGTNPYLIIDCLRHWVLEYHIDGVHINTEVVPAKMIKEDPVLAMAKIFADMWDVVDHFTEKGDLTDKRVAIFNDEFMINIRRFIKSDEGQLYGMASKLKSNPASCGVINYLANHYTFTLMDAVSYDKKHNEENGEENRDGTEYNYSWNCGIEGITRKKRVKDLRIKQIKNALTILFLSQGTPMVYSGDEMGRSQRGNNNPYCQDNDVTWINWNLLKTNKDVFDYVKELVAFRERHKMLHLKEEPKNMDYLSKGVPDISFHGTDPWRADFSYGSRQLAVLYNGQYGVQENSVYVAFNMYWEPAEFNVPAIAKDKKWKTMFITDRGKDFQGIGKDGVIRVPERTIVVMEEICS